MFDKVRLSRCIWAFFIILGALVGAALLWTTGCEQIGSPDEALHWTQPWRFVQGDVPFLHEWHPSVLCGILLVPILKVFQFLGFGDVDGFMVSARHSFAIVWVFFVVISALKWRQINSWATLVGILMILVYPPWGECNFSYNAIGVLAIMVSTTFYASNKSGSIFAYLISGLFFAVAVLCCPHLILVYLCYSIYAFRKERMAWVMVSAGCAIIALVFLIYLFSQISFTWFLDVLPNVLTDPEHANMSILALLRNGIGRFFFITHDYAYGHGVLMGSWVLLLIISILDKDRLRRINFYSSAECILALSLWFYYSVYPLVGCNPYYMVVPLLAGSVGMLILTEDSIVRQIFFKAWLPVAGYAFVLLLSSNLGLYSSSFAFEAASIPAAIILFRFMAKKNVHALVRLMILSLMCLHIVLSFRCIICRVAATKRPSRVELMEGPLAGARVSPQEAHIYNTIWDDTKDMRVDNSIRTVCFLDHRNQWLYLTTEKPSASFSSWMCGVNTNSITRLDYYWELCPEKMADAIFLPKKHDEFAVHFEDKYGYQREVKESGNIILHRKSDK
jgi:hypothetical protein